MGTALYYGLLIARLGVHSPGESLRLVVATRHSQWGREREGEGGGKWAGLLHQLSLLLCCRLALRGRTPKNFSSVVLQRSFIGQVAQGYDDTRAKGERHRDRYANAGRRKQLQNTTAGCSQEFGSRVAWHVQSCSFCAFWCQQPLGQGRVQKRRPLSLCGLRFFSPHTSMHATPACLVSQGQQPCQINQQWLAPLRSLGGVLFLPSLRLSVARAFGRSPVATMFFAMGSFFFPVIDTKTPREIAWSCVACPFSPATLPTDAHPPRHQACVQRETPRCPCLARNSPRSVTHVFKVFRLSLRPALAVILKSLLPRLACFFPRTICFPCFSRQLSNSGMVSISKTQRSVFDTHAPSSAYEGKRERHTRLFVRRPGVAVYLRRVFILRALVAHTRLCHEQVS